MQRVYLDNNATTRVDPAVVQAMLPLFTDSFGNGSSMHSFGGGVARLIRHARMSLTELLGAQQESEVIFTSGGTEANTSAIFSAIELLPDRKEIITSTVEHPAILAPLAHLEKTRGYTIHRIPVDAQGRLDIDAYRAALSDKVALVTIMWANNETGTLFPVPALATLAKEVGALFHTDAVQAVGKVELAVKSTDIDMLSLSGHKFHAPKGTGALYVRKSCRFRPLFRGGHQERDRRAGTENAPGIVGLGKAAELALEHHARDLTRIRDLRDRLEAGILQQVGAAAVVGDRERRLPNTATIAFEFIEGESILLLLDREGIAASSGSACTSGSLEPSHVLRAMGVPYTAAHGAIRFSLSRETTDADVDRVLEVVPGIVARLRSMSPYWEASAGAPRADFAPAFS
ncbi:MAG: cysteine desulfurase NifS [Alphaproteobacteria bacterium]|nr:cysteine desulfurase NifS [Alphaproteobacteria bacterium]TAD90980.1 MAG: cysteine desulfurase NifS [Alphaproteobacteria bacterium]